MSAVRKRIAYLRKRAKNIRTVLTKVRDRADELEKPLLLLDAKKMYERKCYISPNEWTQCVSVIKAERMFQGRVDVTSKIIRISKGEDGYYCVSKQEMDLSQVYFKNEMPEKDFMKIFHRAILSLTPEKSI